MTDFNSFVAVDEAIAKLNNGSYMKVEMDTKELLQVERIQVRSIKSPDRTRVRNIIERFDMEAFDPVVVIVDESKNPIYLLDGNHRLGVMREMNFKKTPTIQIPFIDLYNSRDYAYKLGFKLNVSIVDKKECDNEDIKALIKRDYRSGVDVKSDTYLRDLSLMLRKAPAAVGRLRHAALMDERSIYRTFDPEELEEETFNNTPADRVVYRSGVRVAPEQGLGALLRRMTALGVSKGRLIIYPAKVEDMTKYDGVKSELENIASTFNLDIDVVQLQLPEKEDK